MAEFVNRRIEDMMLELEQMKRIQLYTAEEIREITKKRTDFEYKIHRQTKNKEDYLRYIAYECALLQNIKLRRKIQSMDAKKSEIDYALSKRVRKLYSDLVHRFPGDLDLWLNYILFCRNVNFSSYITAIFEQLLQVHGDKARVWQMACRWEYEEMHNIDTARKFILKGLQRHPVCKELYVDAFQMELKYAENADEEKLDKQLERAKIFLKSALKHIPDVSLVVRLCSIANCFEFAGLLREKLFTELWENYNDKKETWDFIARCESEGKFIGKFEEDVQKYEKDFFLRCPDRIKKFFSVYETAFEKISPEEATNSYIENAIKSLVENSDEDTIQKLQILKRALSKGHMVGQLNEQHYKLWIDLLSYDKESGEEEIARVLEEASVNLPTSEYVWEERLKRNKSNPTDLIKIFKKAEAALPAEKGAMLWNILLENTKDLNKLKKLYEESLRLSANVSKELKPVFLQAFYNNGGITAAREQYGNMVKIPPFEMKLHKKMMELEGSQKLFNYKHLKNCHEIAAQQFGKRDPQVWMDFIHFEMNSSHPECCGPLYNRACSTLERECVDKFIVMYSLSKN